MAIEVLDSWGSRSKLNLSCTLVNPLRVPKYRNFRETAEAQEALR